MNNRSEALAARLESGAIALGAFAATLTEAEWQTRVPKDGRKIGVVVHHVASVYPVEIHLGELARCGSADHRCHLGRCGRDEPRSCQRARRCDKRSRARFARNQQRYGRPSHSALSDDELDRAAPVSLNSDAPLTCQFMLEDHAVRHSYHHLARIRAALIRQQAAGS